jgi:predicted GNAT superfamily acetyltransferase
VTSDSLEVCSIHDVSGEDVDALRSELGAPDNPTLFPAHFLKASFPRLGGRIVRLLTAHGPLGIGFLFPRELRGARRRYTLRLHRVNRMPDPGTDAIERIVAAHIGADVTVYEPGERDAWNADSPPGATGLQIGEPSAADADAIRDLQQQVWNPPPDALYPRDLHSPAFHAGDSMVATVDGALVGFLFGFFKFEGAPLPAAVRTRHPDTFRLESQLLAVLPSHNGKGIARVLKLRQAARARAAGIHVVNWTFDPLQFVNATLNLTRLGAVAFDFYRNHYQFSNDLAQTPASRVSVTWLIETARVAQAAATSARPLDLADRPDIVRLNDGPERIGSPAASRVVAIEIPADWTRLQQDRAQRPLALAWRSTTDALFGECLGIDDRHFALTGTAVDGDRRYLVAERVDAELLARVSE